MVVTSFDLNKSTLAKYQSIGIDRVEHGLMYSDLINKYVLPADFIIRICLLSEIHGPEIFTYKESPDKFSDFEKVRFVKYILENENSVTAVALKLGFLYDSDLNHWISNYKLGKYNNFLDNENEHVRSHRGESKKEIYRRSRLEKKKKKFVLAKGSRLFEN